VGLRFRPGVRPLLPAGVRLLPRASGLAPGGVHRRDAEPDPRVDRSAA
jgi:hypothetical protein